MLQEISNFQTEETIKQIHDDDLLNNFAGISPNDEMKKFIHYKQLINQKKGKYPFLISKTEDSTKDGEHWWSILDIQPKKRLVFLCIWCRRIKKLHSS